MKGIFKGNKVKMLDFWFTIGLALILLLITVICYKDEVEEFIMSMFLTIIEIIVKQVIIRSGLIIFMVTMVSDDFDVLGLKPRYWIYITAATIFFLVLSFGMLTTIVWNWDWFDVQEQIEEVEEAIEEDIEEVEDAIDDVVEDIEDVVEDVEEHFDETTEEEGAVNRQNAKSTEKVDFEKEQALIDYSFLDDLF